MSGWSRPGSSTSISAEGLVGPSLGPSNGGYEDDGFLAVAISDGPFHASNPRVCALVFEGGTQVEELWFNNQMRVHFGTAIRLGDTVYASSGDFGPAPMTAVDIRSGEVLWRDRSFAKCSAIYADGKLVLLDATELSASPHPKVCLCDSLERVYWKEGRSDSIAPATIGREIDLDKRFAFRTFPYKLPGQITKQRCRAGLVAKSHREAAQHCGFAVAVITNEQGRATQLLKVNYEPGKTTNVSKLEPSQV